VTETTRSTLPSLVAEGVMDAELGALVELLVGARIPALVAGPGGPDRDALLDALLGLLPAGSQPFELAGDAEEFEWLPEATELGWRREHHVLPARGRDATPRASSVTAVLVMRDLAGAGAASTRGERARLVVRSLALGYGLVAGIDADGLEGVLNRLADPVIGTDEDERSRLGLVLALAATAAGPRVVAAHYLRPLARDQHGHRQLLPPAVLATLSPASDRFDHFAWGVLPELATRLGWSALELEREQARRSATLRAAAAGGGDAG
jgi:hypothetical protein